MTDGKDSKIEGSGVLENLRILCLLLVTSLGRINNTFTPLCHCTLELDVPPSDDTNTGCTVHAAYVRNLQKNRNNYNNNNNYHKGMH